jgi:O-antigen ligase
MPTPSGLPVRPETLAGELPLRDRVLTFALALYAATTLVSMAVMSIGAAIAGVAILWALGGRRALGRELKSLVGQPEIRRYFQASLALVGVLALSTCVARIAPLGWGGRSVQPGWEDLSKYWYFVWPLVLMAGLSRLRDRERGIVLKAWLGALAVVSVIGIAQFYTGWPRPQRIPSSPAHFHATMFLGHHLSVASILIFPFFASLDLLRASLRGTTRLWPPLALGAIAVLSFVALFLSYSRMLWIALPLGLVLWAARSLSRKQLIAGLVAAAVAGMLAFQSAPIRQRVMDGMGVGDRQKLWKANIEFLKLRPLTGAGFRRNNEASGYYLESLPNDGWIFSGHAHNNAIDMLGGTGILGLLAWIAWCGVLVWISWRGLRRGGAFAWAMVCAWVVFHLNGLTQVNFWEGKVMHQMMWATAWAFLWVLPKAREGGESERPA